jgi:CelD/BcsL family acetyltransferase involved in cellulose biosynthesis
MSVELARSADQALTWFEEMVTLHEERWRAQGEAGAFLPTAKRFHTTLIERVFGDEGDRGLGIDIVRVRFGEATIGILYNLVYRGCVHFYQSGLNYHDDARLKPGFVAHALTIERCVRRGDEEYDFLGGEPEPVRYKRSLSTDRRTLYWAELRAASPKMAMIRLIHRFHRSHTRT